MAETVFILGAGASRAGGAPLMSDFLDKARRLHPSITYPTIRSAFDLVLSAISQLQIVHSKSDLDLNNFEEIFGLFEMALLFKTPIGKLSEQEAAKLPDAVRTLIVHTLEESLRFPVERVQLPAAFETGYERVKQVVRAPAPYVEFVEMALSRRSAAVITFNYDLAIDYAIQGCLMSLNYFLDADVARATSVPLIKLHGSLNWGACSSCQKLHAAKLKSPTDVEPEVKQYSYRIDAKQFFEIECCGQKGGVAGVTIVPPTWSKGEYHQKIGAVWRAAARHLSEARNIVVIGYSLPKSDMFFRYLFGLGTIGEPLNRVVLMDPDPDVQKRFKELLGTGAKQRFKYLQEAFTRRDSIEHILAEIG